MADKWAMLCKLKVAAFTDPRWRWERKLDGDRVRVTIAPDFTFLTARSGTDKTALFPELRNLVYDQQATAVLDCEVVSRDGLSFQDWNQRRINRKDDVERMSVELPGKLMAFDVLSICGEDLARLPLERRRAILVDMRLRRLNSNRIEVVPQFEDGVALFERAKAEGWEGVVGKCLDDTYMPGRRAWVKVKVWQRGVFRVVGWDNGKGKREGVAGCFYLEDCKTHRHVGKVGTGFTDAGLDRLTALVRDSDRPVYFKIKYVEVTNDGLLRFPVYQGLADGPEG